MVLHPGFENQTRVASVTAAGCAIWHKHVLYTNQARGAEPPAPREGELSCGAPWASHLGTLGDQRLFGEASLSAKAVSGHTSWPFYPSR